MKWFYADQSDQQQEFQEDDFSYLVERGTIQKDTLVWNETMDDWKNASEVKPELFEAAPASVDTPTIPPALTPTQEKRAISPVGTPYSQTATPQTDPLAIVALVLGIMGFLCFPLLGLGGVICGHMAYNKASRSGAPSPNKGLALGGIITGYIGVLVMVLIIVFYGFAFFMAFQEGGFEIDESFEVELPAEIEESTNEFE